MTQFAMPALFALFVWWFSTGLIIYLDMLKPTTFRASMTGATVVVIFAVVGLGWSAGQASMTGAYVAFTCGVLVWGWIEMSFYLGYVTGPRRVRCAHGCAGWKHFGHALQVSLHHELVILGLFVVVLWATWDSPNKVALWTFVVLWWMHQSARLNVFLGVRNVDEEFLPPHLDFLRSFFARKPMNPLFPVSIAVSSAVLVWLLHRAATLTGIDAAGMVFVATMMGLAILEHIVLMVPLPTARLWRWSLRAPSPAAG
jgi:putative photosynthetic complex assembly protein 2